MSWQEQILECFTKFSERELNYFAGLGELLRRYQKTSGNDRDEFIKAVGEIIVMNEDPSIVADLVYFAYSLDIAQLDPAVERLRESGRFSNIEFVQEVINNYFAYRRARK